jgi:hypothetical protein
MPEESAEAQKQALTLRRQLVEHYPRVPSYREELAVGLQNAGIIATDQGRPRDALPLFDESIRTLSPLFEGATDPVRSLASSVYEQRALALLRLDRHARAEADLAQAIRFSSGADKVWLRAKRAEVLVHIDPTRAVAEADALMREARPPVERRGDLSAVAANVCALAALHEKDESKRDEFSARSVVLLRQALARGYFKNPAWRKLLVENAEFKRLRSRKDFKAFLDELADRYR